MKQFNETNIKNSKQFNSALNQVMQSIAARNEQIQQLLILAVKEASRVTDNGQATNNLTWLSKVLEVADNTRGINATKIAEYVKECLCMNTVKWDSKTMQLKKLNKETQLSYDVVPAQPWYEYGKKPTVKKAFDSAKTFNQWVDKSLDKDKGNMTEQQVWETILSNQNLSVETLLELVDINNPEIVKAFEAAKEPNF